MERFLIVQLLLIIMKILLLGKNGQLGSELTHTLVSSHNLYAFGHQDLDVRNLREVARIITNIKPQVIINATGYTAVDRAEQEQDLAFLINRDAVATMAEAAAKTRANLIHFSTDYVFDGQRNSQYSENDFPHPINTYGRSKLAGEKAVTEIGWPYLIFRTSWLYNLRHDNFVTRILAVASQKNTVKVVIDQVGSPTWARWLASTMVEMLNSVTQNDIHEFFQAKSGIYHVAGKGETTRFDWAKFILAAYPQQNQIICRSLQPAPTSDISNLAHRPKYSALDCSLFEFIFQIRIPRWEESQKLALLAFDKQLNQIQ
jgi:dTDP-4-dehydrorhamnose reductase